MLWLSSFHGNFFKNFYYNARSCENTAKFRNNDHSKLRPPSLLRPLVPAPKYIFQYTLLRPLSTSTIGGLYYRDFTVMIQTKLYEVTLIYKSRVLLWTYSRTKLLFLTQFKLN